jgi:hypothetical protein
MLAYNPAYDIYHCIYRMIFILKKIKTDEPIEIDRLRIIDFYLVFPYLISEIKFPRETSGIKKSFLPYSTKYRKVTNKFVTFQTMKPLQDQAIDYLCLKGYIYYSHEEMVAPTLLINSFNAPLRDFYFKDVPEVVEQKLFNFILNYNFYGKDGLKDRTSLMEFKYDKK